MKRALLVFAAAALLYTGAGFLPGRTFAPLDLPLDAGAWKADPTQRVRVSNSLLSDVITQFIPWDREIRRLIERGELPWTNRWAGEGSPLFANPQTALFSPFTWPRLLFGLNGWAIASLLKMLAAALCAYWLARELEMPASAARISGLVFATCGYSVVWLLWPHTSTFAVLPGLAAAAIRLVKAPRGRNAALVILFAALATAGGHPETLFVGVIGIAVFLIWEAERQPGVGLLSLIPSAVGALLGFLLLFVVLAPFLLMLGNSHDAVERPGVSHPFRMWAIPSQALPGILGSPLRGELDLTVYAHGESFNHRNGAFVGAIVLLAIAVSWRTLTPTLRRGLIVGTIALLLSWYPPGVWAVFRHVPVVRMLALEYGAVLFALFGSLAAGPALAILGSRPRRKIGAALIVAGVLMISVAAVPRGTLTTVARSGIETLRARGHLQQSTAVYEQRLDYYLDAGRATAVRRVALPGLCFVLAGIALLRGIRTLLVGAALAELFAFGYGYNPAVRMTDVPPEPGVITAVKRADPDSRYLVAAPAEFFPANLATLYRVRDVVAYDVMNSRARVDQMTAAGYDARLHSFGTSFTPEQMRVLATMGVRYVIGRDGIQELTDAMPVATLPNEPPRGIIAGAIVSLLALLVSAGWLQLYRLPPVTPPPPSERGS